MRIHIASPGCRLNQAEIESVATELKNNGHIITHAYDADMYIINSCSVTGKSERTVRNLIYKAAEACGVRAPGHIILTGCATDSLRTMPEIIYVSNDHKYLIPEIVNGTIPAKNIEKKPESRFNYTVALGCSTRRVNLKIQDGCDNYCSYCIIPLMRGAPVSKPFSTAISEFRTLIENGFREVILTGANIGKYHDGGNDLSSLVQSLLEVPGDFRIHLSSLDPECITPGIAELFSHKRMVRHLHLSLQSGSDRILKFMNRRYTGDDYLHAVESLRRLNPDINLTTDVITGFPGETDSDHRATVDLIKQASFSHVHTFRYSPRPGTKAALMKDTVPEKTKSDRSAEIIILSQEQKNTYYRRFNDRTGRFLSETSRGGITPGFNEYYVPVRINTKLQPNTFFTVQTAYIEGSNILSGKIIE